MRPDQLCATLPDLPVLGVVLLERFLDYASPIPVPTFDMFVASECGIVERRSRFVRVT